MARLANLNQREPKKNDDFEKKMVEASYCHSFNFSRLVDGHGHTFLEREQIFDDTTRSR